MQIGIDSFVDARQGLSAQQRIQQFVDEVVLADELGLDIFGVGEHHRADFLASSPAVLLGAAAVRTKRIRLTSAVTVLSSDDPVRVFQDFATVDLLSGGRAEIIIGRGSFIESYPLFGYDLNLYDELFAEKMDLLLRLREEMYVHWSGQHRTPLAGQGVFPRPVQSPLPVRIGVGGTPQSFARAGALGLPLVVAIIGGEPARFRPLVDLYREAGRRAGHKPDQLAVGVHTNGYLADSTETARNEFYPSYADTFNRIGRERGWPPVTRAQFDATCGRKGALMVGSADAVTEKMLYVNEVLGGVSRMTVLMNGALLTTAKATRSMELLGTHVAPVVRRELAAVRVPD